MDNKEYFIKNMLAMHGINEDDLPLIEKVYSKVNDACYFDQEVLDDETTLIDVDLHSLVQYYIETGMSLSDFVDAVNNGILTLVKSKAEYYLIS